MTNDRWAIRVCNNPEKDWIERSKKEEISDDIVTRLRKQFDDMSFDTVTSEAADEIERLRKELQSYYDEDEEIRRGRSGE